MRCYALGGLCVAVVTLAAWGGAAGGSDDGPANGAVERGGPQTAESLLPVRRPLEMARHVQEVTPTPEPARQVVRSPVWERQTNTDEPTGGLANAAAEAPVTFYACHGLNGGFCAGAAGPLPLVEGQAACGDAWPLGAVLVIDEDPLGPVVCNDRGRLAPYQVDRFFWREEDGWAWLRQVGSYARVQRER